MYVQDTVKQPEEGMSLSMHVRYQGAGVELKCQNVSGLLS